MSAVHVSPFSGSWYPARAGELGKLLDTAFERSAERTGPWLPPGARGFVVPHAGPLYSGTVAAAAYRAIEQEKPRRVVLLGFSHHGGARGVALPRVEAIATPLGETAIDAAFLDRLAAHPPFARVKEERVCDHSVEIQLPFLRRVAPDATVAPLYVGTLDPWQRDAAAEALAALWEPGTLLVASSDLTHYGRDFGYQPFPVDSSTPWRLREVDLEAMDAAGSLDPALFHESLAESGATVCGAAPIALLLETLRRLDSELYQETLDYQSSGEITGDWSHSVSYGALGYYPAASFSLDDGAAAALVASAEETLAAIRRTGRREQVPAQGGHPALEARRGAFVSLHRKGELLGCVGHHKTEEPLRTSVAGLAVSAALEDPRFSPAAKTKGPIDVEVSVLTPMKRFRHAASFHTGRHGAFLKLEAHRGLLLPQVAEGRSWKAEDFLKALARKSGLGGEAWRDPRARLYCFEAQILTKTAP
jgi:AmmeMemoRadiSam system protein B/AmmeMemoRadiSam system protein A